MLESVINQLSVDYQFHVLIQILNPSLAGLFEIIFLNCLLCYDLFCGQEIDYH